ncbi:hypothetical protein LX36DRAFT_669880 [Colletotrichum falcatum]|nr:hypothetical protein LX36DRAFT_669880 [Colletotrichum falcatum]
MRVSVDNGQAGDQPCLSGSDGSTERVPIDLSGASVRALLRPASMNRKLQAAGAHSDRDPHIGPSSSTSRSFGIFHSWEREGLAGRPDSLPRFRFLSVNKHNTADSIA